MFVCTPDDLIIYDIIFEYFHIEYMSEYLTTRKFTTRFSS